MASGRFLSSQTSSQSAKVEDTHVAPLRSTAVGRSVECHRGFALRCLHVLTAAFRAL